MKKDTQFSEYYVGRRGVYHNKNVVIISAHHELLDFQDFGFNFNSFSIVIFFEDGTDKTVSLTGGTIKKNLKLFEAK